MSINKRKLKYYTLMCVAALCFIVGAIAFIFMFKIMGEDAKISMKDCIDFCYNRSFFIGELKDFGYDLWGCVCSVPGEEIFDDALVREELYG